MKNLLKLGLLVIFMSGASAFAETATYECVGQCKLNYQVRHSGATGSTTIDVGPVRVTIGTPSENAIHAGARVKLTPLCRSACDGAIRAGQQEQSCRLSGTGPCSRVRD